MEICCVIFWVNIEILFEFLFLLVVLDNQLCNQVEELIVVIVVQYYEEMVVIGYYYLLILFEIIWGFSVNLFNWVLVFVVVYDIDLDCGFCDGVVYVMDYLLGCNLFDQSYIVGYGVWLMCFFYYWFWVNGVDFEFFEVLLGVLFGGLNYCIMIDLIVREMDGQCVFQICWVDYVDVYVLNEVVINWNVLFFVIFVYFDVL